MAQTQKQIFYQEQRRIADAVNTFAEIQRGANPMTDAERIACADRNPKYEFMRPKPKQDQP